MRIYESISQRFHIDSVQNMTIMSKIFIQENQMLGLEAPPPGEYSCQIVEMAMFSAKSLFSQKNWTIQKVNMNGYD